MSGKNFSRSPGGSLVPRSSRKLTEEVEQEIKDRVGRRAYYKGRRIEQGKIANQHRWKPKQPRMTPRQLEAEREKVRNRSRLKLIAELANRQKRSTTDDQ